MSETMMMNGSVGVAPKLEPPLPTVFLAEERYFICHIKHASFSRKDGHRIIFTNGFLATKNKHDIEYLDQQLEEGNEFLALATSEQVKLNKQQTDPREFYKEALRPELEAELRSKLEVEIRAELAGGPKVIEAQVPTLSMSSTSTVAQTGASIIKK